MYFHLFFLTSVALVSFLSAKVIHVDATASDPLADGTSWLKAFPHLQSALAVAESGDQIWVAQGRYFPDEGTGEIDNRETFVLVEGVELYGGFPSGGGLGDFESRDFTKFVTVLSGDKADYRNGGSPSRALQGSNLSKATILDGLTISNGLAPEGGGLYLSSSSPTINNCKFSQNLSREAGGGVFNDSSSPTFHNCHFENNSVHNGMLGTYLGGGVYNKLSSPVFHNCRFSKNSASYGGAIYNNQSSSIYINCEIIHTSNNIGIGAMVNISSSPILTNCVFHGNEGAIDNDNSSPVITNCSFYLDGIHSTNSSSPSFANCILWGDDGPISMLLSNHNSSPSFSHCLVEGWSDGGPKDLEGDSNLDGTNPANDPRFADPFFVEIAMFGEFGQSNLRLRPGSPAINAGDSSANSRSVDLDQNPRKVGAIDLGAYETNCTTFIASYPGLDPQGDENNNGLTNFHDYASGADPFGPPSSNSLPSIQTVRTSSDSQYVTVTFPARLNAGDVSVLYQRSNSLAPDSWSTIISINDGNPGTSFSVEGYRSFFTLSYYIPSNAKNKMFFRQVFSPTP